MLKSFSIQYTCTTCSLDAIHECLYDHWSQMEASITELEFAVMARSGKTKINVQGDITTS